MKHYKVCSPKRLDREQKKHYTLTNSKDLTESKKLKNYTLTSSEPQDLKNITHSQVQNLKRLDRE